MGTRRRISDFLPALSVTFLWGWTPLLIVFLARAGFDPYTQNFYRYLGALAIFLPIAFVVDRASLKASLRRMWMFLPMALCVVFFQTAWVTGICMTSPVTGTLAGRVAVPIGLAGAAIFFKGERRMILSWRFLAGAAAVLAGVAGLVLGGPPEMASHAPEPERYARGVAIIMAGAAAWAAYGILIKLIVSRSAARDPPGERITALSAFGATMIPSSAALLVLALLFGDLGHLTGVGAGYVALLFGSGVAAVGGGQVLYYVSLGRIGVAYSQLVTQAVPFVAGLFSYLILGERLSPLQWGFGVLLAGGVVWLLLALPGPERISPACG